MLKMTLTRVKTSMYKLCQIKNNRRNHILCPCHHRCFQFIWGEGAPLMGDRRDKDCHKDNGVAIKIMMIMSNATNYAKECDPGKTEKYFRKNERFLLRKSGI